MNAQKIIHAFADAAADQGLTPGDDNSIAVVVTMLASLISMRTEDHPELAATVTEGICDTLRGVVEKMAGHMAQEQASGRVLN